MVFVENNDIAHLRTSSPAPTMSELKTDLDGDDDCVFPDWEGYAEWKQLHLSPSSFTIPGFDAAKGEWIYPDDARVDVTALEWAPQMGKPKPPIHWVTTAKSIRNVNKYGHHAIVSHSGTFHLFDCKCM